MLRRRGAPEAGAIFVKLDFLDGRAALYCLAPQTLSFDMAPGIDRLFTLAHKAPSIALAEADWRLDRETAFDPDLWIIEVEDRLGNPRLDLAI